MDLTKIRQQLLKENKEADIKQQTNIDGENFQIDMSLSNNGIDMVLTPTNPEGSMILNLSEEEMMNLKNSLQDSLKPKFQQQGLELNIEDINGDNKQIQMSVPSSNIFSLIKNIMR